jgi:hypothetical protein
MNLNNMSWKPVPTSAMRSSRNVKQITGKAATSEVY